MAFTANYYISAVRYNAAETHIDRVKVHVNNGNSFGAATEWTRTQVVSHIDGGYAFKTLVYRNGTWYLGEDVHVIIVNGAKYIRTDTNYKAADNLGNLPRF